MSLSGTERVWLLSLFRNNKSTGFSVQNSSCNSSNLMDFFRCKLHTEFVGSCFLIAHSLQIVVQCALSVAASVAI